MFPVVYGMVAEHDPAAAGPAIAAVTTVGYAASVVGPGSVGAIAESFGLHAALATMPLMTLLMVLLSRFFDRRH